MIRILKIRVRSLLMIIKLIEVRKRKILALKESINLKNSRILISIVTQSTPIKIHLPQTWTFWSITDLFRTQIKSVKSDKFLKNTAQSTDFRAKKEELTKSQKPIIIKKDNKKAFHNLLIQVKTLKLYQVIALK